jgi:hypothetical protein
MGGGLAACSGSWTGEIRRWEGCRWGLSGGGEELLQGKQMRPKRESTTPGKCELADDRICGVSILQNHNNTIPRYGPLCMAKSSWKERGREYSVECSVFIKRCLSIQQLCRFLALLRDNASPSSNPRQSKLVCFDFDISIFSSPARFGLLHSNACARSLNAPPREKALFLCPTEQTTRKPR